MSVKIDMQMPDKCCKCQLIVKQTGMCPLLHKRIIDPGKKREDCPLEECE